MTVEPQTLLGLPVLHRQLKLGSVAGVLVRGESDEVLALLVQGSWGGAPRLLPLPAAELHPTEVHASPFALLARAEVASYESRGARLITADRSMTAPATFEPERSG